MGEMQYTDDDDGEGGGGFHERSQKKNMNQMLNHWKHVNNNGNIPAQQQGNDQINTHTPSLNFREKNPKIQYLTTDSWNGWREREKKSCEQKLSKLYELKI